MISRAHIKKIIIVTIFYLFIYLFGYTNKLTAIIKKKEEKATDNCQ